MAVHIIHETTRPAWPELLGSTDLFMLYKHSSACMTSMVARSEVHAFHKAMPDIPIHQVDVIADRRLAHRIAADLQVRHESPQVILIREGRAVWHTSHFAIKAATLVEQVTRASRLADCAAGSPVGADGAA